ncbi:MAG TPA: hypothetical protein VNB28_09910 [Methylomirabilota bacterium]|nr:hypothetical protein [Methylomirabilota bacterium]
MLSLREASYALFGAWRLAHFDLQGTTYFDRSPRGALRSFWVAAILLPAYVIMVLLHLIERPAAIAPAALVLVHGVAYLIGWTAYQVTVLWLARFMDREAECFGYIAMYNWSQLLIMLIVLPVSALRVGQMLPEGLTGLLELLVNLAVIAYLWFIARAGLQVGPFAAMGLVAVDLTLSMIILGITDHLALGGRVF